MARNFAYISHIPLDDGIWHVRIYNIDKPFKSPTGVRARTIGLMRTHADEAFNSARLKEINIELIRDEGVSEISQECENELFSGAYRIDNLKLKLEADLEFQRIIDAVRDTDEEVWIELVWESLLGQQLPTSVPLKYGVAKRQQQVFWGRLIRRDVKTKTDAQKMRTGIIRDPNVTVQLGTLELSVQHWMNVAMDSPSKDFLDWFWSTHTAAGPHYETVGELVYQMLVWLSPTHLLALVDERLDPLIGGNSVFSVTTGGAVLMPFTVKSTTMNADSLNKIRFMMRHTGGTRGKLFLASDSESLYARYQTMGELLSEVLADFDLKFQCELPTLELARDPAAPSAYGLNSLANRSLFWHTCSRWLICGIDKMPLQIKSADIVPIEDTVDVSYAPIFFKKITVTEPSGRSFVSAEDSLADEGGRDVSRKTVFRYSAIPGLGEAQTSDFALWVWDYIGGSFEEAIGIVGDTSTYWGQWHSRILQWRWRQPRAIVEFEFEGTGIQKYQGPNNFGMLDWSEFPLMRRLEAAPGLLFTSEFGKEIIGDFNVIKITREPGGARTKLRIVERSTKPAVTTPDPDDIYPRLLLQGKINGSVTNPNPNGTLVVDTTFADPSLASIAPLGTAADKMLYTTGVNSWAETPITSVGRSILDDASVGAVRTTLGLDSMALQPATNVTITGGSITGITDLAIADGGTGASTFNAAQTNLGFALAHMGSNVTTTSNTLVQMTGLTLALGANQTWQFEFDLQIGSTNSFGMKVGLNFPGGATCNARVFGSTNAAATDVDIITAVLTSTSATFQTRNSDLGIMRITGIIATGASSGNLDLHFLKVTSGTAKILTGSYLKAQRIS